MLALYITTFLALMQNCLAHDDVPEIAGWSPSKGIHFTVFGQNIDIDLSFYDDLVKYWDSWIGVTVAFFILLIALFMFVGSCMFRRCKGCLRLWSFLCCNCCCGRCCGCFDKKVDDFEPAEASEELSQKPIKLRWV